MTSEPPQPSALVSSRSRQGPFLVREIRDVFRYREVFLSLVARDFKGRYRAKILGIFWSIADPLVMMGVYTLVFTQIFRRDVYAYPVVLLLGLCPHRFFANGTIGAANSLIDYSSLVRRVPFPRHLLPPAVIASHGIHFGIECCLIVIVSFFFPGAIGISAAMVWLPVIFAAQLIFMCGMGFLTAAFNVWYRDVQHVLRSMMLVLYWLTPIFYPASFIPERLRPFFALHPMSGIVIGYRNVLLERSPPDLAFLGTGLCTSLLILLVGVGVFRRNEGTFADYV